MNKKGARFEISTKGFAEYAKKLEALEKDAGKAAVKCVEAAQDILYEDMRKVLARHKDTGVTLDALKKTEAKYSSRTGIALGEVGIFAESRNDDDFHAFMRSRYIEYGTPVFKADPWLRPAMDDNEHKIRSTWRAILQEEGVPVK